MVTRLITSASCYQTDISLLSQSSCNIQILQLEFKLRHPLMHEFSSITQYKYVEKFEYKIYIENFLLNKKYES